MNKGKWHAIGAYAMWGLLPVYWKWLNHIPASQLLCHRILWAFLWLLIVIAVPCQWKAFFRACLRPRILAAYGLCAAMISINWFTYVWAVNSGFIVEASLGYFINPLLSVLMGVIFLRERLRPLQWAPLGLAAVGVLYLTLSYGSPPWIALILSSTWAIYGLVKKIMPLDSIYGVTLETGILFAPVLIYLIYLDMIGQGAFLHGGAIYDVLLVGAGLMTTIPLLLFASAVQRISLSLIGILQYICPTLQFLLGTVVYKEPFTVTKFVGFGIVWVALLLFGVEGFLAYRARAVSPALE
jgi:chloramphenicol-sensitive protein RarD